MKLLVPTNWDPSLIAPLSKLEASIELYGVLPTSMIGSGGSGPDNVYMMGGQEEAYIKQAHSAGLKFDYLLNAPSMSNMEWDEKTHGELLEHLEWINSIEADSVTVTIPYLIELIKRQFPHLKTRVSTIAHVDSVARAKSFESLGADSITLDININRDFKLLKAIRNAVSCELVLLANNLCIYKCPYEYYHHDSLGHASQRYNPCNGCYVDYCVIRCTLDRLCDISKNIQSRWVRPEDIYACEETGIDVIKISGRSMPTDKIVNTATAYSSRHYQGNLHDILNVLTPKIGLVNSGLPGAQNDIIATPPNLYIDNQALEGFTDFFRKQNCLAQCHQCNYCQKIAMLKTFLDNLSSSKIFKVKAGVRNRLR